MTIDKEKILATIKEVPCDTKVKLWMFTVDKKNYQIVRYSKPRLDNQYGIWECNKKGVRTSQKCLMERDRGDYLAIANAFIEELEKQPA